MIVHGHGAARLQAERALVAAHPGFFALLHVRDGYIAAVRALVAENRREYTELLIARAPAHGSALPPPGRDDAVAAVSA